MKIILPLLLVISLVLIIGCNQQKPIGGERDEHGCLGPAGYTWCDSKQKCLRIWEEECQNKDAECTTDSDCTTAGCSGTICQSKDKEPIRTTCIYSPEYGCYKDISCSCINSRCEWDKTEGFNQCVEDNRN